MKTKTWVILLSALALVLAGIVVWQFLGQRSAGYAEIVVDGELVKTVDLSEDQRVTVECADGYNVIVVENGTIRVAEADCRGNDCVKTGAKSGGMPIICLPHRMVIRFSSEAGIDGLSS